jgi:chemotaxis signal transduction protein
VNPDDPVLAERARRLARPAVEEAAVPDALVVALGGAEYAFPTRQVAGVAAVERFVRIPGAPPRVAGMMNLGGAILAVLDLGVLLGLPPTPPAGGAVVVVPGPDGRFGLLVERVLGVRPLPALPPPPGEHHPYVAGVGADGLVLLDPAAIAADEDCAVDEPGPAGEAVRR